MLNSGLETRRTRVGKLNKQSGQTKSGVQSGQTAQTAQTQRRGGFARGVKQGAYSVCPVCSKNRGGYTDED